MNGEWKWVPREMQEAYKLNERLQLRSESNLQRTNGFVVLEKVRKKRWSLIVFSLKLCIVADLCRKTENLSWFGFKNSNHSKIWHPFRRFCDGNCMQSAIHIKSDKNNFTCIQCAGKERFKTLLKQSLDIDDTQCDRYSLLTTVLVRTVRFNVAVTL